jgi:AraC-like DNA-binding protein
VELYIRLCAEHGVSRKTLLDLSGVKEREVNPPTGWVEQAVLEKLFYSRLTRLDKPILGIELATDLDPSRTSVGLLGFLCLSCPSLEDLHYSLVNFGRLVSNIFSTQLMHEPGVVLWSIDLLYRDDLLVRDNTEWFLASCAQLIHRMDPHALKEARLAHGPLFTGGKIHRHYKKAFPCPIQFDQPYSALVIDPQALKRKSCTGDAAAFSALCKQAQILLDQIETEKNIVYRVKQEIRNLLAEGKVSRAEVCSRIGISSRQLHRRLQANSCSYQSLLDDIRSENAIQNLAGLNPDIDQISIELGFSGVKSFSRWFQGRFGETPGGYRRGL